MERDQDQDQDQEPVQEAQEPPPEHPLHRQDQGQGNHANTTSVDTAGMEMGAGTAMMLRET